MKIGIPKEIKPQEARVGVTPAGAQALIQSGHEVYVQKGAADFAPCTFAKCSGPMERAIQLCCHLFHQYWQPKRQETQIYRLGNRSAPLQCLCSQW